MTVPRWASAPRKPYDSDRDGKLTEREGDQEAKVFNMSSMTIPAGTMVQAVQDSSGCWIITSHHNRFSSRAM